MKKIFLLFMILGLSFMSFVDTQAFSHTTFYGYDLDTINQDLGGVSIRDFFENYNLIQNHDFSNGTTNWFAINSLTLTVNNNVLTISGSGTGGTGQNNIFNSTDTYYIRGETKGTSAYFVTNTPAYPSPWTTTSVDEVFTTQSYLVQNNNFNSGTYIYLRAQNGNQSQFANIYVINISSLGIQLSLKALDHFYFIYSVLINSENAYDDGYDDGNLDGYGTGFNDGTTYGQNEYHTGNYGTLDETLGIPYNDGYNAGVAEELDTNYLLSFVQGSIAVLGAPILPNITLGVFVFVPLFFGFIAFLFRLGGKRG